MDTLEARLQGFLQWYVELYGPEWYGDVPAVRKPEGAGEGESQSAERTGSEAQVSPDTQMETPK